MSENRIFFSKIKIKSNLRRIRTLENRDLKNGLRLNRNERVLNYENNLLEKIFKKNQRYNLAKYPDHSQLYNNISKFFKIKKENFLLTSGIDGGLKTIFETLTKPGDKICALHPSYGMYEVFSKIFKTKFIKINYNLDSLRLDKIELEKQIKKKPKILILPNPNQPIEDYLNINYLKKITLMCKKNNVILVIDEAYFMFGSQSSIGLVSKNKNLIILRSFSKSFGLPSIRLGFMITHSDNIKFFDLFRLTYESNYLTDTVANYFLTRKNLVINYNKSVVIGRNYLKKKLTNLGLNVTGAKSNFLLVKFENDKITNFIKNKLNKKKIYVRSYGKGMSNFLLITCGPKKIMKTVFKEIDRHHNIFKKYF
ncbi:aminotransferase class I/II-fold pyridoxal phosphate-dependent enzyme [Candidatus Pelagibacter sp.]|nr:aminotransferase class I/II-fold pyridoxal phosphate-dependent enzyme [Candidatus Pelagibacter sp.]